MPVNQELVGRHYPPTASYLVGREKIREFATAIGDANPLYQDVDSARRAGYSDLIAPPTFPVVISLAAAMQVVTDPDFGLDYSQVVHGDQSFSYLRPVTAGDEVEVVVSIQSIRLMAGNDVVTTKAEIRTVGGEPIVAVLTTLVARPR